MISARLLSRTTLANDLFDRVIDFALGNIMWHFSQAFNEASSITQVDPQNHSSIKFSGRFYYLVDVSGASSVLICLSATPTTPSAPTTAAQGRAE